MESKIEYVSIEGMCSVVERYIYDLKGVRVNININYPNRFILQNQFNKLCYAYDVAKRYYNGEE